MSKKNRLESFEDFTNLARQYIAYISKADQKCDISYGTQYALNMLLIKAGIITEFIFEKLNPSSDNKMISVKGIRTLISNYNKQEFIIKYKKGTDVKKLFDYKVDRSKITYVAVIGDQAIEMYSEYLDKTVTEIAQEQKQYQQKIDQMTTLLKSKYEWLPLTKITMLFKAL